MRDTARVVYLREQPRAAKHVAFDVTGSYVSVSCSDGNVYVYSFSTEQPELLKKIPDLIRGLNTEAEESSKIVWHPDGRAFGAPTADREVQVMSRSDWEKQRSFKNGHSGDISALAWSPNGALLATAGMDRKIVLWETSTQKILQTYDNQRATILAMHWHPVQNILSYTNNDGELYIHEDFVPEQLSSLLEKTLQPAPFIHDPLAETSGNIQRPQVNGIKVARRPRAGTPDSLDEIMGSEGGYDDGDGFIDDDDGAGYAELNGHGKRTNAHLDFPGGHSDKRRVYDSWRPRIHDAFQPGSTPWQRDRKYLCLNLIGVVWTVDLDTHHEVTVEFYDREFARGGHFTDLDLFDKACLNEHGVLFSCPPSERNNDSAVIYYRPHEHWTSTRGDWRVPLPQGEKIQAIALSSSYIVVTTSSDYVRIYSLFGVPIRVYRQKASPTVTCAAWRDYVMTVGNGPVGGDGSARLLYTIQNIKRDEVFQSEDIVALAEGAELRNVFFSDNGDPCIYDTTGTLLVLLHWRTPGQAQWVPLLDTKLLSRLVSGKKTESYWPVAVSGNKFHCIILKGEDKYPKFPRPLLSDFDFKVPLTGPQPPKNKKDMDAMDEDAFDGLSETQRLEETFVRASILHSLQEDTLSSTRASAAQRRILDTLALEVDKALLQLLNVECREGEERGMKALEIVGLLKNKSSKMFEAAGKVATRYDRDVLASKIREMEEKRIMGEEGEEEDEY